jgi:glutamate-5-semialdehyde dehydrogenase
LLAMTDRLSELKVGMAVLYGGDKVAHVSAELAAAFVQGDRLVVVQSTGDLLHVPADAHETATVAVTAAARGFESMGAVSDDQITAFYRAFADRLADDAVFAPIATANQTDMAAARARGRSTTRLELTDTMRQDMIAGLQIWEVANSSRDEVLESISHQGWQVDLVRSGLGIIGFIFEGRPNVFADATGVLRGGNAVVFRIGSDALGTARAIVEHALDPAVAAAGLPAGIVSLVDSPSRAAGWALFSDPRLSLAVARGSGAAVDQLGAVARQAGIPVSLHGTGGAWIVAGETADAAKFASAVENSLDRKVCNTLNTCCIVESRASDLIPVFLAALDHAGVNRSAVSKLYVTSGVARHIPEAWFDEVAIGRADGDITEPRTEVISDDRLGDEWEWEDSPEVTLTLVADQATAVRLFNEQSPRFGASLIAESEQEHQSFWATIDSPFVGNGFTRWIDGQYALNRPELGLSNWQGGRLFGRPGVLSGDSAYTVRTRATQSDPDLKR